MEEIWKDVNGFEGLYQVSNLGNVKSLHYFGGDKEHIMHPALSKSGYLLVTLTKNKKHAATSVHVIVAKAFVDNKCGKTQVNHIDGNKRNNNAENLEWVTAKENHDHAVAIGLKSYEHIIPPWYKPVLQYDMNGNFVKEWKSKGEAAAYYGCNPDSIRNCIRGRVNSCKGYIWKYKPKDKKN